MNEDHSTSKDTGAASSEPVSSSSQNPSGQGVFSVKKVRRPNKRLIIVIITVILALIGVGIWWWASQHSASPKKEETAGDQPAFATVCDNSVIQSAGKPIGENNIEGLQSIAESILQKKNYNGDVNCNYILMRYYLMIGDVENAKSTLDNLTYTYGHYGGYSVAFNPPAISLAALKETLEVMIANNKEAQKQDDELNGLDP